MRSVHVLSLASLVLGCAGEPSARPAPGTGCLWGHVRAVRRDGVKPIEKNDPVYADRRARPHELVDYRKPGFTVVYADGAPAQGAIVAVELAPKGGGPAAFSVETAAASVGGRIALKNGDGVPRVISCPRAGLLREVPPGGEVQIPLSAEGAWKVFSPGEPELEATIFAAPGPFCVAGDDGAWRLDDVPQGVWTVRAWHPRLPAGAAEANVVPGGTLRVDIEVGVNNLSKEAAHAH